MAAERIDDAPAASFAEYVSKQQFDPKLLSGPTVDIYLGPTRQHWSLHRNLLCHHSDYFSRELLPNENRKTPATELALPDDDPLGFELLVKWLYQGKLEDVSNFSDPYRKYDFAAACHKLYLLCERFEIPQLKNMAMDQYRKGLLEAGLVPDADEIHEIYRRAAPGTAFRELMIRIAARQIMDPDSDHDAEQYRACFAENAEFAIDLVNAIRIGSGGMLLADPTEGPECAYHDHEDGPDCHIKSKLKQSKIRQGYIQTITGRKHEIRPSADAESAADAGTVDSEQHVQNASTTTTSSPQLRPGSPFSRPESPARTPSTPHLGERHSPPSTPRVDSLFNSVDDIGLSGDGSPTSKLQPPQQRDGSPSPFGGPSESFGGGSPKRGRRLGGGGTGSAASTPRRPPPKLELRHRGSSKGSAADTAAVVPATVTTPVADADVVGHEEDSGGATTTTTNDNNDSTSVSITKSEAGEGLGIPVNLGLG